MPHSIKRSVILLKLASASCQLCCTDENAYLYRYTELSVGITRFILSLVGLTRKWKNTFPNCRCHIIYCTCVYTLVVCRDKAYATFHQKIRDFAQISVGIMSALLYRWKCIFIQIYRIIGRDNPVYTVIGRVNPKMKNKYVFKLSLSYHRLYMRIYSCCLQRQSICHIPSKDPGFCSN